MGAVYSDALIWAIWGEAGREKYRLSRKTENTSGGLLTGSGFEACFHNGSTCLNAVCNTHKEALLDKRLSDIVSPCVSAGILDSMLVPELERRDAMGVKFYVDRKIREARDPESLTLSFLQGSTESPVPRPTRGERASTIDNPGLARSSPQSASISSGISHRGQGSATGQLEPSQGTSRGTSSLLSRRPTQGRSQNVPGSGAFAGTSATQKSLAVSVPMPPVGPLGPNKASRANHDGMKTPEVSPFGLSGGNTQGRKVDVDEVYRILERKGKGLGYKWNKFKGSPSEVMELPGIQDAICKIKARGGRDQVCSASKSEDDVPIY